MKRMIRAMAAVLVVFTVGCSGMKLEKSGLAPDEVALKVYEATSDDGTANVVIVTWPDGEITKDIPQAKFARNVVVQLQQNGCTKIQTLFLAAGWGAAFDGKDLDYGILPDEGTQNSVLWVFCAKDQNFAPPIWISAKKGGETLVPPLYEPETMNH